jgi:hypothetical protein
MPYAFLSLTWENLMDVNKVTLSCPWCVLLDAMEGVASGGQLIGGYVIFSRLLHCVWVGA